MKEKTRNNILIVIAVLLLAGGVYYASLRNQGDETLTDDVTIPQGENTELDLNGLEGGEVEGNTEVEPAEENTPQGKGGESPDTNKTSFDTAMKSGATASLAGNYPLAITHYKSALALNYKNDIAHTSLSHTYAAKGDFVSARASIDSAIAVNPSVTEYWVWKLTILDDKTASTFSDLKKVYTDGLAKVDSKTKINLVTHFARMAESNKEINEAVSLWTYAKTLNSGSSAIYQAEINRLNKL